MNHVSSGDENKLPPKFGQKTHKMSRGGTERFRLASSLEKKSLVVDRKIRKF